MCVQQERSGVQGTWDQSWSGSTQGGYQSFLASSARLEGLGCTPWDMVGKRGTRSGSPICTITPVENCRCIVWRRKALLNGKVAMVKCWLGSVLLDKMSWHRHQPCKRAGHRMFHHQGLHNSVQEDSCRAISCRGANDVPACGDCE